MNFDCWYYAKCQIFRWCSSWWRTACIEIQRFLRPTICIMSPVWRRVHFVQLIAVYSRKKVNICTYMKWYCCHCCQRNAHSWTISVLQDSLMEINVFSLSCWSAYDITQSSINCARKHVHLSLAKTVLSDYCKLVSVDKTIEECLTDPWRK